VTAVRDYVHAAVTRLLDQSPVVVWYDPGKAFADVANAFDLPDCAVVLWDGSSLRTRRAAEEVYAGLYSGDSPTTRGRRLLLYLPMPRSNNHDAKRQDPLEVFAAVVRRLATRTRTRSTTSPAGHCPSIGYRSIASSKTGYPPSPS